MLITPNRIVDVTVSTDRLYMHMVCFWCQFDYLHRLTNIFMLQCWHCELMAERLGLGKASQDFLILLLTLMLMCWPWRLFCKLCYFGVVVLTFHVSWFADNACFCHSLRDALVPLLYFFLFFFLWVRMHACTTAHKYTSTCTCRKVLKCFLTMQICFLPHV